MNKKDKKFIELIINDIEKLWANNDSLIDDFDSMEEHIAFESIQRSRGKLQGNQEEGYKKRILKLENELRIRNIQIKNLKKIKDKHTEKCGEWERLRLEFFPLYKEVLEKLTSKSYKELIAHKRVGKADYEISKTK